MLFRSIRLARQKNSRLQVILVHKYDRFARSREDAVLYKSLLKKNGVKVISIKEPVPEDDKFAVIYESMLEAMAEYYSLNLAEEVHKTMQKRRNRVNGRPPPPSATEMKIKAFPLCRKKRRQYAGCSSSMRLARPSPPLRGN